MCFASLTTLADEDLSITHSKSDGDGAGQRLEVLRHHCPVLAEEYEDIEEKLASDGQNGSWKRRITSTRLDDVLDAMALALTASRDEGELATLPADPPTDGKGLPMEIVYPVE